MSAVKHTPGPWSHNYVGSHGYCIYAGGKHIGLSILYKADGGEANARLMAAAPDLLNLLREARDELKAEPEMWEFIARIDAAIAKATGSAS